MNARRLRSLGLPAALGCLVVFAASDAAAATIKLRDGSVVTVEASQPLNMAIGLNSATPTQHGGGMRYSVIEPTGRAWAGTIPGTVGSAFGEASVAQSPVTGDVYTVFSRYSPGGSEVAFSWWTGQTFTEPGLLASITGNDVTPVLGFGEAGDAVLSWEHVGLLRSVYVRHFELAPTGLVMAHSFSDLGAPEALLKPASGVIGLRPGMSHVAVDSVRRHAYVFLANEERDAAGLVRLNLDALFQGGGFNAPPVPVSLSAPVTQSLGTPGTVGERTGDPGSVLSPWHVVLTPQDVAYYWLEDDRMALVLFRGETGGRLISLPLPATEQTAHVGAYQAALRELARIDRRGGERPVLRHR